MENPIHKSGSQRGGTGVEEGRLPLHPPLWDPDFGIGFSIWTSWKLRFAIFWPRFPNGDLRIRPLGGNFTENLIFMSKILNSNVQRPKNRKIKYRILKFYLFIWGSSQANEHFQSWRVNQSTNASTFNPCFLLVCPWVLQIFLVFVGLS